MPTKFSENPMSRREEILRQAAEAERATRARRREADRPYDGRGMDCERMPAGCWLWVAAAVAAAVWALGQLARGL